jgi:hypothetical protein
MRLYNEAGIERERRLLRNVKEGRSSSRWKEEIRERGYLVLLPLPKILPAILRRLASTFVQAGTYEAAKLLKAIETHFGHRVL